MLQRATSFPLKPGLQLKIDAGIQKTAIRYPAGAAHCLGSDLTIAAIDYNLICSLLR